ncbi:hypothetical protein BD779DRAFT_1493044 [Infundibulicybe gibba]|nr:hypothetical protein BD779DRAFT_1493044 [Infundibulicybe gibba]
MADSSSSNNFNLFIGALSLVTAITSSVLCFRAFLPRAQMRLFIEIMDESKAMFLEADQKGLIQDESVRQDFTAKIEQLESLGTNLHDVICEAKTQFEEHVAALKGLSRDAMQLVGRARYLRSWIATHTAQEKLRRQAERGLAADQDRANISRHTDQEFTNTPPPDAMSNDFESTQTEEGRRNGFRGHNSSQDT